jgi:CubicO group peptidase (beta-lactamase class C family)
VREFIIDHRVPGLSLAVSRNDRLVYSAAAGWADAARTKPLTLSHRLRIASCSKPLTAITLLRLREAKLLGDLDAPVFGAEGLLAGTYGVPQFEGKPANITVRQLLQHTSGGWGNKSQDPMFVYHDLELDAILSQTVKSRPLEHAPGTHYEYSNFGYAVLGRVIEKLTGTNYEAAVRQWVLKPCGAETMRMAAARGAPLETTESYYFGAGREKPYSVRPEIMQAHGGWASTPLELLRVVDRVDGHGEAEDILSPETLRTMTREGLAGAGYGLGWAVNQANNWWHMGSLPGTGTMIARTEAGYNWALLTNTRSPEKDFMRDLDGLVWRILKFLPASPGPGGDAAVQ